MSSKHAPVWPIYKRLLGYTRAYWGMMVAAVIAMAVESVAGYHFTKLMEPLVNRGFVNPEPKMVNFQISKKFILWVLGGLEFRLSRTCSLRVIPE